MPEWGHIFVENVLQYVTLHIGPVDPHGSATHFLSVAHEVVMLSVNLRVRLADRDWEGLSIGGENATYLAPKVSMLPLTIVGSVYSRSTSDSTGAVNGWCSDTKPPKVVDNLLRWFSFKLR